MREINGIARVTKTLASKSSMNPTLILCALVVPLSLLLGFLSVDPAQTFFFGLSGVVVGIALLQIVGFSIFAPNRLDDHRHTENKLLIQAAVEQGDRTILIPETDKLIGNPTFKGDEK